MLDQFIERRRWKLFRHLVRVFLKDFAFDRMVAVICDEQRRQYYEDNASTRHAQFVDAVNRAIEP